ncbi:MAG: hypothetical protein GX102_13985 [Porphyromonadaceae bacterium]|nr:hypothetical protein [Porphyromonadaceae bacterium]
MKKQREFVYKLRRSRPCTDRAISRRLLATPNVVSWNFPADSSYRTFEIYFRNDYG